MGANLLFFIEYQKCFYFKSKNILIEKNFTFEQIVPTYSMKKIIFFFPFLILSCYKGQKKVQNLIEIDFQYINQKIVIPVEIDNEIYKFCLDTGGKTSISSELNIKLNPKAEYEINISDANDHGGIMKSVLLDSLKIGGINFLNINALAYDFGKIFECFEYDGYIGSDLLLDYIVQIDLHTNKIRFSKDINLLTLDKSKAQEMVLINDQGSPYVWVHFDDNEKPFKDFVMVDTGMKGIYDLSLDTYERLLKNQRIKLIAEGEGSATVGVFGISEKKSQYLFYFPEFSIGNFSVKNYVNYGTYASNSRIGSELLEHGKMTFDFINEKFYFDFKKKEFEVKQYKRYFAPTFLK